MASMLGGGVRKTIGGAGCVAVRKRKTAPLSCFLLFISTKICTPDKEDASLPRRQIRTLPGYLDAFLAY